jgi:hypothetical protein
MTKREVGHAAFRTGVEGDDGSQPSKSAPRTLSPADGGQRADCGQRQEKA